MKHAVQKIGIFGFGNMMEALLLKPLEFKTISKNDLIVSKHKPTKDLALKKKYKLKFESFESVCVSSDIWLFGVKPQQMSDLLKRCKKYYTHQIVWTMAAGLEINFYQKYFGKHCKILRFMPNVPTRLGLGATAFYASSNIKTLHKQFFKKSFSPTGLIQELNRENLLHSIVALSGSGPAFIYEFVQCLSLAAQKLELPKDLADRFAKQTAFGASVLLNESQLTFSEQIQRVASKNGTTEAGLKTLKEHQFSSIVAECLKAAMQRSQELTQ